MSFLLYNPLEALVLILPMWILKKEKINWKNKKLLFKIFIKDCYIIGTILLISQVLLSVLAETLLYMLFDFLCVLFNVIVMCLYEKIRFKQRSVLNNLIIVLLYNISLSIIVSNLDLYQIFINGGATFWDELYLNLYIKFLQILILIIILGGFIMLKKNLIKSAKKNLGKTVASTMKLVGESKLSEKLKREVKNSK